MNRRTGILLLTLALGSVALVVAAQSEGPLLHEYIPDLGVDEGTTLVSSGGAEPEAIMYSGEVLSAPEGGGLRAGERAMSAAPGNGAELEEVGRRSPSFRPDRVTALHGEVGYFEVFSPGISPFKRVTALDAVTLGEGGVPVLTLASGPRRPVVVEGASAEPPDWRPRDRFWGSVMLDFSEGGVVPFPSVSPESRILTLRVEPADVRIHLEQDQADNFYAVLDEERRVTEVRVVFLTDAPRTYFATELPSGPADALAAYAPELPAPLMRRALEVATRIGVHRGMSFDVALSGLVEHFRSFEESEEPPRDTGDIYVDLSLGLRGVCRHRAYGFVITAAALGIQSRFVQNEAHAWVEVHLPENRGWLRVDLGGAARGLRTQGDQAPPYRPTGADTLPRPEPYLRAYAEARATSEASEAAAQEAAAQAGAGQGTEPGAGADTSRPGVTVEEGTAPDDGRAALTLRLDGRPRREVMRGSELEVAGSAWSGGAPVAGLRVEILLAPERYGAERPLGVTVSDAHGLFQAHFGVPPDLGVGEYRLIVRSPGDASVGPAIAP